MPRTPKVAALASVLAAAVLGAAALAAVAQTSAEEPPLEATPGDTTTTTSPPLLDPFATTTTTITASEPPPTSTPPPSTPPEGGGDGVVPPGTAQVVPPEYQKLINSLKRSRANNTGKLLAALRPLLDLGLTETEVATLAFGQFPVAGYATFSDDWWNPRFVPSFHLHEGTDIFAAHGTPVRAPFDGTLKLSDGPVGGLAAYVTASDGGYAYLAHLSSYPEGLATGQQVKRGDIVGFNGDSGNARGGSPHVHFELHPAPTREVVTGRGRNRVVQVVTRPVRPGTVLPPVNPKPYLDKWIADAMTQVPAVIAQYEANRPRAVIATGLTRQFGDGGGQFSFRSTPPLDQLLWVSSASPSGGALQVAQAHAARAASTLDWEAEARRAERRADAWQAADRQAQAALALFAPASLVEMLGWEEEPS